MGMPVINIDFTGKANTFVTRSQRGVVGLLIKDATVPSGVYTYKPNKTIAEKYSDDNMALIKATLAYNPFKLVVGVIGSDDTIDTATALIKDIKINYLAVPFATSADIEKIKTFLTAQRKRKIMIKAVLANCAGNAPEIINFTTTGIKKGSTAVTTENFTAELAAIFATMPLDRSATFYVLPEITEITSVADEDTAIDNGELILTNDGEKIKIARAVNSLKTLSDNQTEDMKKIKIVEAMDMITEDIFVTFRDKYVGKIVNDYAHKMLLISAINDYFEELRKEGVLNGSNTVDVDMVAIEKYAADKGVNTDNLTEQQIREYNIGSNVFLTGTISLLDAMEDLQLNLVM